MTETTAIVPYYHEKIGDNTKTENVTKCEDSMNKINPKDPKLLDTIARRFTNIAGEDKNIKTLICCLVSKDLPKQYRLSIIIQNPSSTGKSYLLNNVLNPFRDELGTVIDYTDFTEAHFKRSHSDVNGKIIKIEQLENKNDKGQLSFQRLKHLLSEGRLKFGLVDKNESGQNKTKDFEIVGIPVIVTTATETKLDSETENRFLLMQLDESEPQTQRIVRHTLGKYSQINFDEQEDTELIQFFKNLKSIAQHIDSIVIPFCDKIENIIPKNLEIRRDLQKILNLTCILAFIHALNRDHFRDNQGKHFLQDQWASTKQEYTFHLIAKPEDFIEAVEIAGETIKQTINKSSQKLMQIHAILKKLYAQKGLDAEQQGVTVKEAMKEIGLSENRTREYLNELCDRGFASKNDEQKINKYHPEEKKFSDLNASNIIFTEKEYEDWVKTEQEKLGDRFSFVSSCKEQIFSDPQDLGIKSVEYEEKMAQEGVSCTKNNFVA